MYVKLKGVYLGFRKGPPVGRDGIKLELRLILSCGIPNALRGTYTDYRVHQSMGTYLTRALYLFSRM